jgi:alkanesulfonate monooxygenase SsuD/methylene tetrahydromethanopterin reductase-like flavin-dependent oxidoreductase (luciferase family)
MLKLVARYADQWNSAWYGRPESADRLRENIGRVNQALDEAGRDPSTLTLTAGIFVATAPGEDDRPETLISGSAEEIAEGLAGYAELGISHLIVHLWPRTVEAVHQLAQAAALARQMLLR